MGADTFSHSGDLGDLIAHLPVIEAKGGGRLVLYPDARTGNRMQPDRVAFIAPLLDCQSYIRAVSWGRRPEGLDLDGWRDHYKGHLNLTDMAYEWQGLPFRDRERPWLSVVPRRVSRVIFHRSFRYHGDGFPWRKVWELYHQEAVFIGLPEEHSEFCSTVGPVSYIHPRDMLHMAEIIAGAELYCGNQSGPFWVAEALKVPTVLEMNRRHNNCHWERTGAIHGWGADVWLPPLAELPARLAANNVATGKAAGRRLDQLPALVPFKTFTADDKAEQLRHLAEDLFLYQEGKPRYVCSLLGALYQELEPIRPDLLPLILEATWMARRMNDRGRRQEHIDWD